MNVIELKNLLESLCIESDDIKKKKVIMDDDCEIESVRVVKDETGIIAIKFSNFAMYGHDR